MSGVPVTPIATTASLPANGAAGRHTLVALCAASLAAVFAFRETWLSLADTWTRTSTFNHGWLVLPAVGYLIARKRAELARAAPAPDLLGLLVLTVVCGAWWLGTISQVQLISQLACVAALPALAYALAGRKAISVIAFPLACLVFAVPFGEELVPSLMTYTADFAVGGLWLFGIPVYREGMLISIPAGDFEVAKACSGIRYLIASAALGSLYAYLIYRSARRRLAFLALCLVIPVVANGLRALLIILLAHWSDMRFAAGIDHLIYGWLFFGLVMAATFWLGSLWREPPAPEATEQARANLQRASRTGLTASALFAVAIPLVSNAAAKAYVARMATPARPSSAALMLPGDVPGWQGPREWNAAVWKPLFRGWQAESLAAYDRGGETIWVYIARYEQQSPGSELINSENRLYDDSEWHLVRHGVQEVNVPGAARLNRIDIRQGPRRRSILYWYVVDNVPQPSSVGAKFASSIALVSGRMLRSAVVAIAHEETAAAADSSQLVEEFAGAFLAPSLACLGETGSHACRPALPAALPIDAAGSNRDVQ
jgi:exosortase A